MALDNSRIIVLVFGCAGVPVTTEFMFIGCGAVTKAQEHQVALGRVCTITEMRARSRVVPGAGVTDTYTVNITTVGSAATCDIGPAVNDGTWSGAVVVAADDTISIEFTSAGGATAANDCFVTLAIAYQM